MSEVADNETASDASFNDIIGKVKTPLDSVMGDLDEEAEN